MHLHDLRIVVTGAASGLGRHFARRLLENGAHVAAVDRDAEGLERLRQSAAHPGQLHTFTADISLESHVIPLFEAARGAIGPLNGLINAAGIFRDGLLARRDRRTGEITTMSLEQWQQVIDVDLTGPFLCSREFARHLLKDDIPASCIVNISSVAREGNVGQSNYSAAKAGLVADTRVWARELARHGCRVGAIAPGFIDTPILQGMRPEVLQGLLDNVPLRRAGDPEEVWLGVRFILECDYFTGRCLDIDGGISLG
ncbi:MAG: SDR family oxidoreductase [Deltaproteobacteria bacterium]|nr:MAG: SDR family oxidoreductase [Deltaproteobacteria bacterium]